MHAAHWGIRKSPFAGHFQPEAFFLGETQEESLARLHFLIENGHRLGLLSGAAGLGKSVLLDRFVREVSCTGVETLKLHLADVTPREFLWELAAGLGTNPRIDAAEFALWRQIVDRLDQLAALDKRMVWIGDDAHRTDSEVLALLNRLARREGPAPLPLTLLLAVRSGHERALGESLSDLLDLHVELDPWTAEEVSGYLADAFAREGLNRSPFSGEAVEMIHRLSGGVARRVNRMAELALLAGAGLELEELDAEVIEEVYEELDPSFV